MDKQQRERIYIFDTTLRDGGQTQGISFSVKDKLRLAQAIDSLGIDFIEGGWPGANPVDTEFFARPPVLQNAQLVAFGMTSRTAIPSHKEFVLDKMLQPLAMAADVVCIVCKSWDLQVEQALGLSLDDNLKMIEATVRQLVAAGKKVIIDAEHFFDGYHSHADYALSCVQTALTAGADTVVLCDTNGGSLPSWIYKVVQILRQKIPGQKLGIHCHNDTEQAVANSLSAVDAGVRHVQGTINGLGERCGNANLCSIIPTLLLKPDYAQRFCLGVDHQQLQTLTSVSQFLDSVVNRVPNKHLPYVGGSAFAHKGGLHISAVLKKPEFYEHVPPEAVGNVRQIPVSDQSGRSAVRRHLREYGFETVAQDEKKLDELLALIKQKQLAGYNYDMAQASLTVLLAEISGNMPTFFQVDSYRVIVESRFDDQGKPVSVNEAVVKLRIGDLRLINVAEGNGPVHALDQAFRKDLGTYQGVLQKIHLQDYKVRILNRTTAAITRVIIDFTDGQRNWSTIAVSDNIVSSSFEALRDGINFYLLTSASDS